jgi:phosphate uptake regulator
MNKKLNTKQKVGRRLPQNQIKVQQLKNKQFILTLPNMWATILSIKKGSTVTFVPGAKGGIEIIKVKKKE